MTHLVSGNILLSKSGVLKITDFGLEKISKGVVVPEEFTLFPYMAPERHSFDSLSLRVGEAEKSVLASEQEQSRRPPYSYPVDVWSFGLLLSRLLLVNPAPRSKVEVAFTQDELKFLQGLGFTRETRTELLKRKSTALNHIPETMTSFFQILEKCLNVLPQERPDFSEIVLDIQEIVEDENLFLLRSYVSSLLKQIQ